VARQLKEEQEPEIFKAYEANPLGTGWTDKAWLKKAQVADVDAPQIEVFDQPFGTEDANAMATRPWAWGR
jgi:hypothetical protein